MKKLAIVITHPIQYYVPVFLLLAQKCKLKVFYTWGDAWLTNKYDPGFGKNITWDIPLLDGYDYEFIKNVADKPGSHHSKGIINPNLIDSLEKFSPNAILVHGYIYKSHFSVLKFFKGKIPIWFRGDSTLLNEKRNLKSFLKKIYLKWIYAHIDKAFYVGTNNLAYFKKYGLKDNQLFFSPHAIDNERFAANRLAEVALLKQKLGISDNDLILLYAGKFDEVKNLPVLINAFNSSKLKSSKIKLLLVGNGALEAQLKMLANENENIMFMDFQNQSYLPVIYQACDIFCLPSKSETWGLSVNEAMACGKAIICSDKVGCAVDLVKTNVNGYIFKDQSSAELSDYISQSVIKKEYIVFGQHSLEMIKNWSFQRQASVYLEHLNNN